MFQQLPGLASHAISYHGTYRVYFDKSLGVLQPAKQGDGFLRANVVQAGTNNKITGQALLKSASMGPLVANAVFSTLSMVTGQYFLYNKEDSLRSVIKLAYYTYRDYYVQWEELPSGEGYADVAYLPKYDSEYPILLIELKWNKDVQTAIDQIKEKHYPESFMGYGREIILVGITYDKETKKHTCKIEKMPIE